MIEITSFYLKHQLSDYSQGDIDSWLSNIHDSFKPENIIPGYRDGVVLVRVPSKLKHTTITLASDEPVLASFSPRIPGEEPRKRLYVERTRDQLPMAKSTFVVLYRKDVLAEDNDTIQSDWGAVTHLTSSLEEPEPMHPDTLLANYLHLSGGTRTNMTPDEFSKALDISVNFWKNKVTASVTLF